jgi:hypothetical protein
VRACAAACTGNLCDNEIYDNSMCAAPQACEGLSCTCVKMRHMCARACVTDVSMCVCAVSARPTRHARTARRMTAPATDVSACACVINALHSRLQMACACRVQASARTTTPSRAARRCRSTRARSSRASRCVCVCVCVYVCVCVGVCARVLSRGCCTVRCVVRVQLLRLVVLVRVVCQRCDGDRRPDHVHHRCIAVL